MNAPQPIAGNPVLQRCGRVGRKVFVRPADGAPGDAIVDALIGIEALLNAENKPELTLRVALNYASLSTKDLRHRNFRRLKDLYNVRSRIVHGDRPDKSYRVDGVNYQLPEIAAMSKELLRELIHLFVLNDDLRHNARIDSAFWENKYFD